MEQGVVHALPNGRTDHEVEQEEHEYENEVEREILEHVEDPHVRRKPSIRIVEDVGSDERETIQSPKSRRDSSPRPHVKFSEQVLEIERDPELDALMDEQADEFVVEEQRGDEEEDEDEKALRIARNSPKPDLSDVELELLAQELERRASAAGLDIPARFQSSHSQQDEEVEFNVEEQIESAVSTSLAAVVEDFCQVTSRQAEEDDFDVEERIDSSVVANSLAAVPELIPAVVEDFCRVTSRQPEEDEFDVEEQVESSVMANSLAAVSELIPTVVEDL